MPHVLTQYFASKARPQERLEIAPHEKLQPLVSKPGDSSSQTFTRQETKDIGCYLTIPALLVKRHGDWGVFLRRIVEIVNKTITREIELMVRADDPPSLVLRRYS